MVVFIRAAVKACRFLRIPWAAGIQSTGMVKTSFLLSFLILMLTICLSSLHATETTFCNPQLKNIIHQLWPDVNFKMKEWAEGKGYVSDSFVRSHPYELYDIQLHTVSLLRYAGCCKDLEILNSLLKLYMQVCNSLEKTDRYIFYYYPGGPRRSEHKLDKAYLIWKNREGVEFMLNSSQFLYALSEAAVIVAGITPNQRSPLMVGFLEKAARILNNHYERWCFSMIGPFQVQGWGCKVNGRYIESGLNHWDFLKKKLHGSLGDENSPSYCNAVTDTDLWIITGVANLLTLTRKAPVQVRLSRKFTKKYSDYLDTGLSVIRQRLSFTELEDFSGHKVQGVDFDANVWNDHPGRRYVEYSGTSFPSESQLKQVSYPLRTSWDISHVL